MRSTDRGKSWQQLTGGLPNPFESMVECIEFDSDQPDHVFIGTGGEGARFIKLEEGEIYHSPDRGDHWEKIPLRFPIIYALAVLMTAAQRVTPLFSPRDVGDVRGRSFD